MASVLNWMKWQGASVTCIHSQSGDWLAGQRIERNMDFKGIFDISSLVFSMAYLKLTLFKYITACKKT